VSNANYLPRVIHDILLEDSRFISSFVFSSWNHHACKSRKAEEVTQLIHQNVDFTLEAHSCQSFYNSPEMTGSAGSTIRPWMREQKDEKERLRVRGRGESSTRKNLPLNPATVPRL
jgi:hypothetical protein